MNQILLSMLLGISAVSGSQDINEADLFGDPSVLVVNSASLIPSPELQAKDSISSGVRISGIIYGQTASIFLRDKQSPALQSQAVASLYLDARSTDGTKAFAAIEGNYLADSSQTQSHLRELFLDFDLHKRLYIRTGKQVLQWGRCYFWNPSDLINVERRAFVERAGSREGVYGTRLHMPFGTRANLYGFWDVENAQTFEQTRGSFKAEMVFGGTETALSVWKSQGLDPVFAWDASTRIARWSVAGEAAFFPEGFVSRYQIHNDTLYEIPNKAFTPRAVLSIGRTFDVLEVQERLRVQYELYYNGLGYSENPGKETHFYAWERPIAVDSARTVQRGPKALWLYYSGNTEAYSLGRYYAAFFTSFSRFFFQDLSLSCNGVMNLVDHSWMLATGLDYTTLHSLHFQLLALRTGGEYPAEMTYSGQNWRIQGTVEYSF